MGASDFTLTRRLGIERAAADLAADAPIPVTIATETAVDRYGVIEVLDCSQSGVDLSRAPLSLIVAHDAGALAIGVVEDLRAEGSRVTGMARFASSAEAQQVRADVLGGIHLYLSVGYRLLDEGEPIEGGLKFKWQPHEVSIVPVPADPAAGFFRSLHGAPMNDTTQNNLAADIIELCTRSGVPDLAAGLIRAGSTADQARQAVLNALAVRDAAAGGHINVRGHQPEAAQERERIVNTLVSRMGVRVEGEVIRSASLLSLAVRGLALAGQRVSDSDSRDIILQRALHTTSDFSNLLGSAVGRVLHHGYSETPPALRAVARKANLPDFRDKTAVRLGPASDLEKVNEHGEFKYGTIQDAGNTWKLATYGRIIGLTRQAIVNDDLDGFATILTKFGQAAARLEADQLTAALTTPPDVDGAAIFSAGRNSLIAGATSALDITGIGLAVASLRAQKELGGGLVMQEPAFLIVPAALEMKARQLVAQITPAQTSSVQPYQLTVVVEPRLDATSATAWYLVASGQSAFEYGYLDGEEGVQYDQQAGFEVDGVLFRARLDFGCGWVAPVGWVKSAGA